MKIGRNDPCHCGSGKKYKHCHLNQKQSLSVMQKVVLTVGGLAILTAIVYGIRSISHFELTNENSTRVWSEEHQHYH